MHKTRRNLRSRLPVLVLLALSAAIPAAFCADGFHVPTLTGPIMDQAGLIVEQDRNRIENLLYSLKNVTGTQVAILTVPSLGGLTIEEASIKVVDKWQLGSAERDNGVLLLVSRDDRLIRIEVGRGLEGDLPDAYAKRIIDAMVPYFRTGDTSGGITAAVLLIIQKTNSDFDSSQYLEGRAVPTAGAGSPEAPLIFLAFFLIVIILSVVFGRAGSGIGNHRGRRSWSSGRSSMGSGWSGGGGGFSGGGASGGW